MELIGYPFNELAGDPRRLRFRYRGSFAGARLEIGSNWELGDAGLLWLYSGIVRYARARR